MINRLIEIKNKVKENSPLIHCITNPISINDCANVVLAVGGKPIMAEHPLEVEEITANAKALAVNLGNITDARMKSIIIAGKMARDINIPSIIDMVGVGCSKIRLQLASQFIEECKPIVIKGNASEIKAICGVKSDAIGIDVGENDIIKNDNIKQNCEIMLKLSEKTNSVIIASGKTDLVAYKGTAYAIDNGCEMMSYVTGTGCMLNVLIATYLSEYNTKNAVESTILGACMLGCAGEIAQKSKDVKGVGSFRVALLDNLYSISDDEFRSLIKLKKVEV